MLRRLFALILLVVVVGAAWLLWTSRHGAIDTREAKDLANDAGALATEKIGQMGHTLGQAKITASVKAALELNRELKSLAIDVDNNEGVVTLRGEVPSEDLRQSALRVTRSVPDVKEVRDELHVGGAPAPLVVPGTTTAPGAQNQTGGQATLPAAAAPPATDAAGTARRALSTNSNLAPYALEVQQQGDRLVLTGRVKTGAERDLAGTLAQQSTSVPVDNRVEVLP